MKRLSSVFMILLSQLVWADISLPYIFSDNMVLQRDRKIPVWGFASPNEKIMITFKNKTVKTTADQNGNWKIFLKKEKAGGAYQMKITGKNEIILKNILIGDVYLASGQSNMEWNLASADGYKEELNQKEFPVIRHIKIYKKINSLPQSNISETKWETANAETIGDFSAVAYFFAKKMFRETGVPVGIVNSSWGGTVVEAWIPRAAFEQSDYFKNMIAGMPEISIEKLQEKNIRKKTAYVENLTKRTISDFNETFKNVNFNDSGFPELYVPKPWEQQGYTSVDGVIWFRKTIELTEDDLKNDARLFLGKIDDEDSTYFNGTLVGQSKQWSDDRQYTIPKTLLKAGKNVIAVRVNDTGSGGGFWSEPKDIKLITSQKNVPLAGNWKIAVEKIYAEINQNDFPSMIYNAMIHPVEQFAVKGIIWYQGESNEERAFEYNKSFPLLIESWRGKFGKDIPFYYVQLATFRTNGNDSNEGSAWAELREAQTHTLRLKNTGMVVTTDIGNPSDIHPRNKKTVGERLANLALKNGLVSPVFKSYMIKGNSVIVEFMPSEKLISKNDESLKGFEIAGKDNIFYPAKAEITGNKIKIFSEKVPEPASARYGWKGDNSEINLFTEKGLPVSPFRTDTVKTVTENKSFQISFR